MSWFHQALSTIDPALDAEPGLQALAPTHRAAIETDDPRDLEGSCDIDADLAASHANAPRWDYVIAHNGRAWFVEVHPAASEQNVNEVLRKAVWLRALLRGSELAARSRGLYWLATGPVTAAPAFSRRRRALAQQGVAGPSRALRLR